MIYLASQSPRRKELLAQLDVEFEVIAASIDETPFSNEAPREYVERMAAEKALAGAKKVNDADIVLGSDTIVVSNNRILGKPTDFADFKRMMSLLSNSTHQVMTAVAICTDANVRCEVVQSDVTFKALSEDEITRYWQTNEPCDKAGGYGIQGIAGKFIMRLNGSYSAVVGLPLYETDTLLKQVIADKVNEK
ncbi:Maf family protein [Flocculibacter collagenilyticus]|uniref:Maf family protein n=1 Tax=Flocculibacter collagenilyticus TaxID=2744479 RepID=UPI0018F7510D|nr:Maf family protein [Flocculibacter collagenilyticus]